MHFSVKFVVLFSPPQIGDDSIEVSWSSATEKHAKGSSSKTYLTIQRVFYQKLEK